MPLPPLAAWILTYLVHSTLLGLLALAATRALRAPGPRAVLLRGALLGGLVTATVAAAVPGGRWIVSVPWTRAGVQLDAAGTLGGGAYASSPGERAPLALRYAERAAAGPGGEQAGAALHAAATRRPAHSAGRPWIPRADGLSALALAAGGLLALGRGLRGRRRLALRRPIAGGSRLREAQALLAGSHVPQRVRLSVCPGLRAPLALGRDEIVLPPRALDELEADERRALLAHELGHLARRDPLWIGLSRLVSAALWFQPLNRLLLGRLRVESELAADAWAVQLTREPLALARCLERVGASLDPRSGAAFGVGIVDSPSPLLSRVERLLAAPQQECRAAQRRAVAGALLVLAGLGCGGPAVSDAEPSDQVGGGEAALEQQPGVDWRRVPDLAVVPCVALDAEEGETRTIVNVDAQGLWGGLVPGDGEPLEAARLRFVRALAAPMRRAQVSAGTAELDLAADRLVIRADAEAPFSSVQALMEKCGHADVQLYKIELLARGEGPQEIVQTYLPIDVGVVPEEIEETEEAALAGVPRLEGPGAPVERIELLMKVRQEGEPRVLQYSVGPKRFSSGTEAVAGMLALQEEAGQPGPVLIDARPGVRFGEVLQAVKALRAAGAALTFVGRHPGAAAEEQR